MTRVAIAPRFSTLALMRCGGSVGSMLLPLWSVSGEHLGLAPCHRDGISGSRRQLDRAYLGPALMAPVVVRRCALVCRLMADPAKVRSASAMPSTHGRSVARSSPFLRCLLGNPGVGGFLTGFRTLWRQGRVAFLDHGSAGTEVGWRRRAG